MITKIVHVQSILPDEIVASLKDKSEESSVKEAISKAMYHYLNCQDPDRENIKTNTTSIFIESRIDTRDIDAQKNELGFEKISAFETIPDTDSLRALKDKETFKQDINQELLIRIDNDNISIPEMGFGS